MKRFIFGVLTAISFFLFAAVTVAWWFAVPSGRMIEHTYVGPMPLAWGESHYAIQWSKAGITFANFTFDRLGVVTNAAMLQQHSGFSADVAKYPIGVPHFGPPPFWERFGIFVNRYNDERQMYTNYQLSVTAPFWSLWVITAPFPIWFLIRYRPRRSRPAGTCSHCGYDLRATPDRCPECGTMVAQKA
jgi:hypothetical protein